MEAEKNLFAEFLGTKNDGVRYLTLSSMNHVGVQSWFKYFEDTNTFLDSETKEILYSEFVLTNSINKIAIVDSLFPDGIDNEEICHENLKRFSQPTPESACVVFEFFYNYFHEEKGYKYSPVFLLRKSGSSLNTYMRLGKNTLSAFFFGDKRSS